MARRLQRARLMGKSSSGNTSQGRRLVTGFDDQRREMALSMDRVRKVRGVRVVRRVRDASCAPVWRGRMLLADQRLGRAVERCADSSDRRSHFGGVSGVNRLVERR